MTCHEKFVELQTKKQNGEFVHAWEAKWMEGFVHHVYDNAGLKDEAFVESNIVAQKKLARFLEVTVDVASRVWFYIVKFFKAVYNGVKKGFSKLTAKTKEVAAEAKAKVVEMKKPAAEAAA